MRDAKKNDNVVPVQAIVDGMRSSTPHFGALSTAKALISVFFPKLSLTQFLNQGHGYSRIFISSRHIGFLAFLLPSRE